MPRGLGLYEVTFTIPGQKKKKKSFDTTDDIVKTALEYPPGTKVWIWRPISRMGYELEVTPWGGLF